VGQNLIDLLDLNALADLGRPDQSTRIHHLELSPKETKPIKKGTSLERNIPERKYSSSAALAPG